MSAKEYGYESYEEMINHAEHHGGGVDLDYDGCKWIVSELAALRATVAEQARALAAAHEIITRYRSGQFARVNQDADEWLAAHPTQGANPQPRETVTLLDATLTQMIRIGNALNWNPPIDQEYADAINAIRAALQTEADPQP